MSAPAGPPPPGPPPTVPDGWQVSWSDQYHQWFYVQQATGASQWQHPSGPAQPAAPPQQPVYYPPPQPQYNQHQYGQPQHIPNQYDQQNFAPPPNTAQPVAPAAGGIMGKLTNLDPKAQMALAAGGGLAAGALLEHEIEGFHRPHYGHHGGHHMLGTMAGLVGAAGAGALGAKFFGSKNQSAQAPPQPVAAPAPYANQAYGAQAYPVQASAVPPPPYPGQQPNQSGTSGSALGLGKFAAGGAAIGAAGALAASGVSNFIHHHQDQGGAPPPTTTAGTGGGIGSFIGGLTHSGGPRLIIHAAAYADKDVTDIVRSRVTPDQIYSIEKMSDEFGDPWPEVERKMFSVLYQYGDRPMEVWAGSCSDEKVDIRNEALANVRMSFINKDPGRIVCLIWGEESVLSKERVDKLEKEGELDCTGLNHGGFYPWQTRALICYYKDEHGGIAVGHGREGGTLRLPWNPLAKWS